MAGNASQVPGQDREIVDVDQWIPGVSLVPLAPLCVSWDDSSYWSDAVSTWETSCAGESFGGIIQNAIGLYI